MNTEQKLEQQVRDLEKRIKALEKDKIGVTMTVFSDTNVYRAVQRALVTNPLTIGGGNNDLSLESSALSINSKSRGFLPPRMSENQRKAIGNPVEGLVIYNSSHEAIEYYNGQSWGMYMPIMSTNQRDALTASEGMVIFNDTTNKLNFYTGAAWEAVTSA